MGKIISFFVVFVSTLFLFQNCGVFSGNEGKKFSLLSQTPIFEDQAMQNDFTSGDGDLGGLSGDSSLMNDDGNLDSSNNSGNDDSKTPPVVINDGGGFVPTPPDLPPKREIGQTVQHILDVLNQGLSHFGIQTDEQRRHWEHQQSDLLGQMNNLGSNDHHHSGSMSVNDPTPVAVEELFVHRLCSDKRIRRDKTNQNTKTQLLSTDKPAIVLANSLKIIITHMPDGNVVCELTDTDKIRNDIIQNRTIDLTACPQQVMTPFKITITGNGEDPSVNDSDLVQNNGTITSGSLASLAKKGIKVLFLENEKNNTIDFSGFVDAALYEKCDSHASPLFVDMRTEAERSKGYELSAPWDGVMFDIHGQKAKPYAHAKKKISWFKNKSMGFLVLPDIYGQVKGIDEMFGDGTMGPDGQLASHGFEALKKFDGLAVGDSTKIESLQVMWQTIPRHPDGVIDANDDIYSRLRIWVDADFDGIAENNELQTLEEAKIARIDLGYDPNYSEEDRYGNVVKYKSVVEMTTGQLNLIFDLWFKVDGN
ncbi:MAG: hypothetical protein KDD33_07765 [Bdellovibrionales bacterium]|nr:hypothetical protein [Bdellovibrionales bacterium]